ncbi:hypothetical protein BDK51DRAFT_14038, partial [Blyttiomyces helicus]
LTISDTAGSHGFDRFRPFSYTNATFFLVCFDLSDPASLREVEEKWVPEIRW